MGKKRKKYSAVLANGVMPPIEVALFHDRVKLKKRLAERGHEIELLKGFPAQTFSVKDGGQLVHFVLMETPDHIELYEQLALLAHEATHAASHYFESIGEDNPGEEEWAYVVQAASSGLFDMHLSYLDGKCRQ